MDKPVTLSVKDFLIRNLSVKENIPERIIEAVVNHQFTSAHKALRTAYSLEFSGFGKFYYNKRKARTKLQKFMDIKKHTESVLATEGLDAHKKRSAEMKLHDVIVEIALLKPRVND
jgi:nucleoid DNA-binding protein